MKIPIYKAFTDGSAVVQGKCTCESETCPKCQKFGGYGVYMILPDGSELGLGEGYRDTKTGRMELRAFLEAIKRTPNEKAKLVVYSDSTYIVNLIKLNWLKEWKTMDYMNKNNVDLLKEIQQEIDNRPLLRIDTFHIKGHQTNLSDPIVFGNVVADALADYKAYKDRKTDVS